MTKSKTSKTEVKSFDYDVIIIGTGPGGEGAAMNLAKRQKKVAIIGRLFLWSLLGRSSRKVHRRSKSTMCFKIAVALETNKNILP